MDRKALGVVAVIAVLVGGGLVYSIAGGSDDSGPTGTSEPVADSASDVQPAAGAPDQGEAAGAGNSAKAGSPGRYVDYSAEALASTPGTRLLFFHAPWCPQCRALESDIEASTIPDDVTIFKVDYDSNQDLREQYGVTIQTTVVEVDGQGKKVADVVPYDEPTFDSVEQALKL